MSAPLVPPLPRSGRRRLRDWRDYRGRGVECPLCGSKFRRFEPHRGRPGRKCLTCGSLERHRALWLYLERRSDISVRPLRVLHFAPEYGLRHRLAALPNLTYTTCDIAEGKADEVIDVMSIDKASGSVDVLLCSHVLEHVDDDRQAMRELRRVLAPDGWAFLQVPILRATTDEDPTVTDPDERMARFGQEDHVRAYGPDAYDRLREAGFAVESVGLDEYVSPEERHRYGLDSVAPGITIDPMNWELPICRPG